MAAAKLNDIKVKVPQTNEGIKNFFANCQNRRKMVSDTPEHYKKKLQRSFFGCEESYTFLNNKKHLKKAKHDLERAIKEHADGCWDWTIIKAYYSIHHAGNALLSRKKEFFSKDHTCLIVALMYWKLIDDTLFKELVKLHERFSDIFGLDITFQMRKISQYDVDEWENLSENDAKIILSVAEKFVNFVEANL